MEPRRHEVCSGHPVQDADAALWKEFGAWAGHGTATLGVVVNTAAYSAGGRWLGQIVTYLDGNRRLLAELVATELPGVRVVIPEGSYAALIDFRKTGLTGDLSEWFRGNAGVAMTDDAMRGEAGVGYTRFIFAMPRPLLREAIMRISRALATHRETITLHPGAA